MDIKKISKEDASVSIGRYSMIVSVCIVAYNEEKVINNLLEDLLMQDYPHNKIEVVLIDSMSKDKTASIMTCFKNQYQDEFFGIQVLKNCGKIQSAGWNIAINNYKGDVIIRLDAHSSVPSDFVSKNINVLKTGEYVSGGRRPNIVDTSTPWKETLLLAEQSMFGSSIAMYRHGTEHTYVKSVFHGAYKREVFDRVGLFNEKLGRTEDNEIHYRIRKAGYKICFTPEIISYQHARGTLIGMLKQKYGNGFWVSLTTKVCPGCLSIYHFVPLLFLLTIIITGLLVALGFPQFAIILWSLYGIVAIFMSIISIRKKKKYIQYLLLPIIFLLLHISYGFGSLVGIIKMPFWKYGK